MIATTMPVTSEIEVTTSTIWMLAVIRGHLSSKGVRRVLKELMRSENIPNGTDDDGRHQNRIRAGRATRLVGLQARLDVSSVRGKRVDAAR